MLDKNMAVDEEKIISFVRSAGPIIPVQLAKHIGTNILFASAMLSELAGKGKLKISHVKVGGSPLYYLPGQEHKLQQYSKNLHEKEQKAYELLRQNLVLQDLKLDAVTRVALRSIKDFAIPLEVTMNNSQEPLLFWKWYLLSNQDAEEKIRKILGIKHRENRATPQHQTPPQQTGKNISEIGRISKEEPKKTHATKPQTTERQIISTAPDKKRGGQTNFMKSIYAFFRDNEITVLEEKIIRKGTDAEFVVKVPSKIGGLTYFVKAKSKKNSNDADISSAFLQGQRKNLPTIYLTTGKVTIKARKSAQTNFPSLLIIELENTQ